eukprot:scaffold1637_cov108-Cylindrotheca_fusiformis.AAC.3
MVNWSGIEDVEAVPTRIWLCRDKETSDWQPLRKKDCRALNESPDKPVVIDNGRATADPEFGRIRFNYFSSEMFLTSGTWFMRTEDENDKNRVQLIPMEERDAQVVEQLYQNAIYAASTYGNGIKSIDQSLPLFDEKYRVEVQQQSGQYVMRKVPTGWFARSYDLQRGYGAYKLEGEEEEAQLGPVKHVIFVVHGIGEAMFSKEDVRFTLSMREEMTNLRLTMQKRQLAAWKKSCEAAKKQKQPEPPVPSRVEIIPIVWYDRIHSSSSELMKSLNAITLRTIPALREIANDVIFDVLMYLTPNFCYEVLECVTDQIISIYEVFKKNNPGFLENGGKCSLTGHSLGSVICWDLLAQKAPKNDDNGVHITKDGFSSDVGYQKYAGSDMKKKENADFGSWGPSLPKPLDKTLPFEPDFTLFLGSPVGLFLTLRGAHPVFDQMRQNGEDGPSTTSSFTLPSGSIHNVFHPSDPVAYRIEPLLLAPGTEDLPSPMYLTCQGQGVRFHIKARQLSGNLLKSMEGTKKSVNSFVSGLKVQAASMLQQLDERHDEAEETKDEENDSAPLKFPLGGKSDRVDFQLQPNLIDSEYLSAVLAHAGYWTNTDVIDYMIDLTSNTVSRNEEKLVMANSRTDQSKSKSD